MTFAYPWSFYLLLLLILVIGLLRIAAKKRAGDLRSLAEPEVLPEIIDFSKERIRTHQRRLRFCCLLVLILALAGPEWGYRLREVRRQGPDLIFALDTSKSMLATDIQPNRLERCKLAIAALLREAPGNKVGLIAFAGSSFLQCPLVDDLNVFQAVLASLTVQSIPRGGTAIGTAIRISRRAFSIKTTGRKVLIILTDGENHEGNPIREAKLAAGQGIQIYTIGIGNSTGVPIPLPGHKGTYLKDKSGKIVKTKLDESILKEIAATGNGKYLHGTDIDLGLKKLYQTEIISGRVKSNQKWRREPVHHFQWPLSIAIILLVLELGWDAFKKPVLNQSKRFVSR